MPWPQKFFFMLHISSSTALLQHVGPLPNVSETAKLAYWQSARVERNLSHLVAPSAQQRKAIDAWFGFSIGAKVLVVDGRCLVYATVFKGANNAITSVLQRHGKVLNAANASMADALCADAGASSTFTFTFVREPLSHFFSGFAEAMWRLQRHQEKKTTHAEAQCVIDDVLDGKPLKLPLRHVLLMSGLACGGWDFDAIGRLENSAAEWAALRARARLPPAAAVGDAGGLTRFAGVADRRANHTTGDDDPWRLDVLLHASSADPQGAKARMRELLRERPSYRRALCALLAHDYRMFGYDEAACLSDSTSDDSLREGGRADNNERTKAG